MVLISPFNERGLFLIVNLPADGYLILRVLIEWLKLEALLKLLKLGMPTAAAPTVPPTVAGWDLPAHDFHLCAPCARTDTLFAVQRELHKLHEPGAKHL